LTPCRAADTITVGRWRQSRCRAERLRAAQRGRSEPAQRSLFDKQVGY